LQELSRAKAKFFSGMNPEWAQGLKPARGGGILAPGSDQGRTKRTNRRE
jgi:hypothetical protein